MTPASPPTWGLVATIKATSRDILDFAAHHIALGAHRLHIYLDEDAPKARRALKAHPKARVTVTDAAYWARRREGRPEKHQARQTLNATRAYRRNPQVDWLLHLDVDEFLIPSRPVSAQLAALPSGTLSARARPMEALAPDPDDPPPDGLIHARALALDPAVRRRQTRAIHPDFGDDLDGGFLSHVAGKVFTRTGQEGIGLRIHNALRDGSRDPDCVELPDCPLLHRHAPDLAHFLAAFRFRHARGSYRSELKPVRGGAGLTMHQFFAALESEGGEDALAAFFHEVCTATPALRDKLSRHGLLREIAFDPARTRRRIFPDTPADG